MDEQILKIEPGEKATIIRFQQNRIYQDVIPGFREQILALLDEGHHRVIVDLAKVEVMDHQKFLLRLKTWGRRM